MTGCRKPAYVVFAVDRRASIKDQDLNEQVDLIHTIIRDFSSNHSMVRFALLTFGEGIRAEFGFGDNSSTDAAVLGISGTGLALQNIREVMRNGKRFGVPQIAIVISNGESDFLEETRTEAENVRSEGIILFSVGLGTDVDLESLGVIASKKEFVFEGASHAVFEALESALYTVICN